ncbi:hypothetical protein MMC26_001229 [Xylographa opegraphella]|nr:hypothetical protein [Xylographa opegraphella]
MAQSPSSDRRAQLIREMSRDLNRTRPSSRSSRGSNVNAESTTSDFDPENEALMSTRQLESTTQRLPELRASAQKYGRYSQPEPDFAINTSAIGRAFPDFSQGGSSSEDESMSIEIGRGLPKSNNENDAKAGRSRDFSSNIGGNSMEFSPAMVGNYQVMSTPPKRPFQATKRSTNTPNDSLRRNAQVRRASTIQQKTTEPSPPAAKTTDYVSGSSRQGNADNRRTLSSMHARVADEDAASDVSEDRPQTLNLTARNTRFGNGRNGTITSNNHLPSKFSSTKRFVDAIVQGQSVDQNIMKGQHNNATTSSGNPGTQQSFILPDMPNMSELVSGVFQDGTPVFSRHGKPRASRFASGAHSQRGKEYVEVAGITVPDEEQAIFVSLKLLQDKVADLENAKAEAQATVHELQEKNLVLEREKQEFKRFRRSDSALGTTDGSDGADESGRGPRKWIIEKTRLESSIRTLQEQASTAMHKNSVLEITIRNLTQERDTVVSQLGVAYLTTEQLKVENERLVEANTHLSDEIARLGSHEETQSKTRANRYQGKNGRRSQADQEAYDMSQMSTEPHGLDLMLAQDNIIRKPSRRESVLGNQAEQATIAAGNKKSLEPNARSGSNNKSKGISQASNRVEPLYFDEEPSTRKVKKTRMVVEEYSESEATDDSVNEPIIKPQTHGLGVPEAEGATTGDITFLSFLENGEIAKLRKTLEQERIARKQRLGQSNNTLQPKPANTKPSDSAPLPRKSSMKDLSARSGNRVDETIHTQHSFDHVTTVDAESPNIELTFSKTTQAKPPKSHNRLYSEHSLLEQRNQRDGIGMDDMTSAFIVPDITMRNPIMTGGGFQNMPASAQQTSNNPPEHDGQNCTVCKHVIEKGSSHNHGETVKGTVKIPKPIPVSDRMPEAGPYEEEPTIRPSQPPPVALAAVIKGLEDELTHLKIQLSQYQSLYNQHDPALSKRKRKSVLAKIEKMTQTVDIKSDQIYALYDVLEGQKADGHEISEEEVEITLQSVGIDLGGLGLRGGDLSENSNQKEEHVWDIDSSDESEGDMPWEGIETTVDLTKRSGESRRRSWGA